ncbi:hypothetical protein P9112_008420 [Eukaryota sp. TZLM1-RC]
MLIHSDNGPEFANETFKIVCNRLAIEMSNSIPHYSESNGLVERKHRDVLQCLRKLLIDFNDYGNWSTYVPISQLLINSTKSRKTGFTPYELMFGSSISPGTDPANILGNLSKFETNIPLLDDIKMKNTRLQEKREEAERHQTLNTPSSVDNTNSCFLAFNIGDYVLRKTKQNNKLHGSWNGPFLVIDLPFKSTLLLKSLTTGSELKAAKKDCKIYNAENPQDIEFLKAVAAGDSEKHVIEKILSEYHSDSGSFCTVQWFGGETTEEPLHSVKHSEAYKLFSKDNKKMGIRTTSRRQGTSNESTPSKKPRRSSRIRKRS